MHILKAELKMVSTETCSKERIGESRVSCLGQGEALDLPARVSCEWL